MLLEYYYIIYGKNLFEDNCSFLLNLINLIEINNYLLNMIFFTQLFIGFYMDNNEIIWDF